jgi:hypothetical protein
MRDGLAGDLFEQVAHGRGHRQLSE